MVLLELLHPALIQPVDAQQVVVLAPTTRGPCPASMVPETIIGCTGCYGRLGPTGTLRFYHNVSNLNVFSPKLLLCSSTHQQGLRKSP